MGKGLAPPRRAGGVGGRDRGTCHEGVRRHDAGGRGRFEIHLGQNLVSILKPFQWPLLASLFGFTLPVLFALRDRIGDARLRNSLLVLLPLWAIAMLVVGVVVEVRIFGELIAPVALGRGDGALGPTPSGGPCSGLGESRAERARRGEEDDVG